MSQKKEQWEPSKMAFNISATRHATVAVLDEIQHFQMSTLSQNEVSDITLDVGRTEKDVA